MSLWTPGGEVPVPPRGQPSPPAEDAGVATPGEDAGVSGRGGGPSLEDLSPEERAEAERMVAEMADVQRQIVAAPAAQLVANHVVGFYELAMIHLGQPRPRFDEAQLAIDAMAAVLDAVGSRLGEDGQALTQALNQARVAFVQRREELAGEG
jgi:hypothetical protein